MRSIPAIHVDSCPFRPGDLVRDIIGGWDAKIISVEHDIVFCERLDRGFRFYRTWTHYNGGLKRIDSSNQKGS